ncbi:MAG TPA: hypothetical protein VNE62_07370 [Actinomycetota bacterium]|nr:hypothetical protein [Actinomycetota bacterium]
MKRVRLALAIALAITVLGAGAPPATAARYTAGAQVPYLRFYARFSDPKVEFSMDAYLGFSAGSSGPPPTVSSSPYSHVYMWVRNKEANSFAYINGEASVVIDPALNTATASGTFTNAQGTWVFSVEGVATGTPNMSTYSSPPPYFHQSVHTWRDATAVAVLQAPNATFTGAGGGSLHNTVSAGVNVYVP